MRLKKKNLMFQLNLKLNLYNLYKKKVFSQKDQNFVLLIVVRETNFSDMKLNKDN